MHTKFSINLLSSAINHFLKILLISNFIYDKLIKQIKILFHERYFCIQKSFQQSKNIIFNFITLHIYRFQSVQVLLIAHIYILLNMIGLKCKYALCDLILACSSSYSHDSESQFLLIACHKLLANGSSINNK